MWGGGGGGGGGVCVCVCVHNNGKTSFMHEDCLHSFFVSDHRQNCIVSMFEMPVNQLVELIACR